MFLSRVASACVLRVYLRVFDYATELAVQLPIEFKMLKMHRSVQVFQACVIELALGMHDRRNGRHVNASLGFETVRLWNV